MKDAFLKVREQTRDQEETGIELTQTLKARTLSSTQPDATPLPVYEGHLFSDSAGNFPAKLNAWETKIIETKLERPSFVAWYRNPSTAGSSALRIGYEKDNGEWTSLQPDFIIISRKSDDSLGAGIVDPHGDHLADAKAKLRGLAKYAERFGEHVVRIESVVKTSDGTLRSIDLLDEKARSAVREFEGGKVTAFYESEIATDFQ